MTYSCSIAPHEITSTPAPYEVNRTFQYKTPPVRGLFFGILAWVWYPRITPYKHKVQLIRFLCSGMDGTLMVPEVKELGHDIGSLC
jgi:hypothetical protein